MADVQIPREAVEAGARALLKHELGDDRFDQINPMWQHNLRERAIAALNAAAPLIVAAEMERMAAQLASDEERDNLARLADISDADITAINDAYDVVRKALMQHAAALRAQT